MYNGMSYSTNRALWEGIGISLSVTKAVSERLGPAVGVNNTRCMDAQRVSSSTNPNGLVGSR